MSFKDWLIMSENKNKKMFNLDKPKKSSDKKDVVIKLGEVQPDTLFSDRGHMSIKTGGPHTEKFKKPTRNQEKINWRKDQDL